MLSIGGRTALGQDLAVLTYWIALIKLTPERHPSYPLIDTILVVTMPVFQILESNRSVYVNSRNVSKLEGLLSLLRETLIRKRRRRTMMKRQPPTANDYGVIVILITIFQEQFWELESSQQRMMMMGL